MLSGTLPRFLFLYALLYGAFGVASPFLPAFLAARGLEPQELGVALAAGTAIRLVAGPLAGRLADLFNARPAVLALCAVLAALAALTYLPSAGFWIILVVVLAHSAALAPLAPLSDALAVNAATHSRDGARAFEYGWVRGAGSAAFILGALAAGQAIDALGLATIILLQAALLAGAALCASIVPDAQRARAPDAGAPTYGVRTLAASPAFRRLVLIAALILGSHAMHDSFALIRWTGAGISAGTASVLWSEAVAAEVIVFFLIGPPLLARLGPSGCMLLAAAAGVLRWSVMALTTDVVALAVIQPLHGITFALLHLACMRLIAEIVPPDLSATAQAIYGTLGIGAATAALILASGWLYAHLGGNGFWVMAALCALACPISLTMRSFVTERSRAPI